MPYYRVMLSRRTFLAAGAAAGGGLILALGYARRALDDGAAAAKFGASGGGYPLNAWLKIAPDNTITCAIHRAEMGQGVTTSLAMLLAEELDADWNQVRFEFAPVDRDYFNFGMLQNGRPFGDPDASWMAATGTWAMRQLFWSLGLSMTISSTSVVDAWDTLRPAGAVARQLLLRAAARRWETSPDALLTTGGWVVDPINQRRASFGELAELAGQEAPPEGVALKSPADFTLLGRSLPRLDVPAKVTGAATFGIDVQLPDMLYATVVHSPVAGTPVRSFDATAALGSPGVVSVLPAGKPGRETAVAVVATDTWQALRAAELLEVVSAEVAAPATTESYARDYALHLDTGDTFVFSPDDEVDAALRAADATVTATYAVPFLAHACMEPMNCTALFTGTGLTVWAPTQAHSIARDIAAELCGLEPEQVTLHTTFMGGGFGRRAEMDFVEQAVSVARELPGRPVKLTWSRAQDMRHDAYRPAAVCRMSGATDARHGIAALNVELATQSVTASYEERTPTPRGGDATTDKSVLTAVAPPVYPVTTLRYSNAPISTHVPAGFWRSVSHSWTTFFLESFIDELATNALRSPLEFRRGLLKDEPRVLNVLNAVAARVNPGADGIGYAVAQSHGSAVAHAVEVATQAGEFSHVVRVVCAIDCGPVVNPDGVHAQLESSVVDGLSAALYEQVDFVAGRAVQANFDTYRRLRLADMPALDIIIAASGTERPGGVGEPAVPGVAPALANAIFAATGQRIRTLPLHNSHSSGRPS